MLAQDRLEGLFAALPTPFWDGAVDAGALAANLERWNETRLDGYLVLGTTGESPLLDDDERELVIRVAREATPSERILLAGTGGESTRGTILSTRKALDLGVDACLVRTPAAYAPWVAQEDLTRHYERVADGAGGPILLYQFPQVTGVSLEAGTVRRLANHDRILGIKESSGDVATVEAMAGAFGSDGVVLTGSGRSFALALERGAAGGILAIGCLVPDFLRDMMELVRAGETRKARVQKEAILPLPCAIPSRFGIAGLKAALESRGFAGGPVRGPLPGLTGEERRELEFILAPLRGP